METRLTSNTIRKSELEAKLIGLVEPVVRDLGYDLRDIEVSSGEVCIILDRPLPREDVIGIEDCSRAHQALSPMFDVWDPIPGAYDLQISSPGESPSLRRLDHFAEAVGHEIRFQTLDPFPMPAPAKPRKNWESKLVAVDSDKGEIVVEDSLGEHRVALNLIKNAQWVRDWSIQKEKPGKGSKPGHQKANAKGRGA